MSQDKSSNSKNKGLVEKRIRNSEAARRCRDKVKQKIIALEIENEELVDQKSDLHSKFIDTTDLLLQANVNLGRANDRIDLLELRLSQLQKYILRFTAVSSKANVKSFDRTELPQIESQMNENTDKSDDALDSDDGEHNVDVGVLQESEQQGDVSLS